MSLKVLGLLVVGAGVGLPGLARAETQGAGAPAADAQTPAPPLVIVADVSDNATQNSQLRAVLYEVARDHGYEAAGKLDVEGTAARESLMKAGAITTDPAELDRLRNALKVAVLVRISKDADQGGEMTAHITILGKDGVRQKVVTAAHGAPQEALRSALDTMLPHVYKAKPAAEPTNVLPPTAAGALLNEKPPPETPFDSQRTWDDRGGFRGAYGAIGHVSGLLKKDVPFGCTVAPLARTANENGVGGGIGARVGFTYLPINDPTVATGNFMTFRGGVGLDADFFFARRPSGCDPSGGATTTYSNQALMYLTVPLTLGFGYAGGHFVEKTAWRGVIVGVAYAPGAQFWMDLKDTVGDGKFLFNPAGAEITVDIAKFDVRNDTEPTMQIRLAAWALFPLDADRPGMLSLGVGAIWY